jgi:hypothetical protein
MSFLKLHYSKSGQEFLINTAVIAGVEINGLPENGCVLTLTITDSDGKQRDEQVKETFEDLERVLCSQGISVTEKRDER